ESGALRIQRVNVTNNLQYAVYTGSCGSFTQIACLQNTANHTINNPALAEQMIYIRVYNYNSSAGGSFQLCVWEPTIPANDNCADAISIDVNSSCVPDTFTNAYATAQATSVAANPSCGFYKGGDVWF